MASSDEKEHNILIYEAKSKNSNKIYKLKFLQTSNSKYFKQRRKAYVILDKFLLISVVIFQLFTVILTQTFDDG